MGDLTLPADIDKYDTVQIKEDKKWETEFVPWLEALEKDGVGVEDGFFVASFDTTLRKVTEDSEVDFLETCGKGLRTVAVQRLNQFDKSLTMHYGVRTLLDEDKLKQFKEETVDSGEYRKDTCCSRILRENGLQALMVHLDSFMHAIKTQRHSAKTGGWASSSSVIVEEIADQMKRKYLKFKESADGFKWESNKRVPPHMCEEAQCSLISDSEESGADDEEEDTVQQKKKRKTMDSRRNLDSTKLPLYGFGSSDQFEKDLKITENFTMKRIFNLLWLLPHMLPGFHSSYYLYGTCHSIFPIHVEDGLTFSMNYVYAGQPKLWVMIPPWATALLEYHLKKCGSFLSHMHCSHFMGHKSLAPTIEALLEFNIPFKIVVQHPGQLVVLYPSTAHYGFNLGRNFAEAINFAIPSWVPWGALAGKCSCLAKQIHIPMKPFIVAFRPDLLEDLEKGRAITTPAFVRGMQLLAREVERISKRHSEKNKEEAPALTGCHASGGECKNICMEQGDPGPSTSTGGKKCPLKKCSIQCLSMKEMLRHVRSAHRPLLSDKEILQQINMLFMET